MRLNGLNIIHQVPEEKKYDHPVIFIHGMWQGSWIWEEYFLDYFVGKGLECYCLNLRGHNGSDPQGWFRFTTIGAYVNDLKQLIESLDTQPIVIGHSMGGFIIQKYLENHDLPLVIMLAPVPPRGLLKPTLRVMIKMPFVFLWSNLILNLHPIINSVKKARLLLLGDKMPDKQVERYVGLMQNESYTAYLGMLFFSLVKPNKVSSTTRIELIGATDDWSISPELIQKTADAYNIEPKIFENRHHNLMLDEGWEEVADYCIELINDTFKP